MIRLTRQAVFIYLCRMRLANPITTGRKNGAELQKGGYAVSRRKWTRREIEAWMDENQRLFYCNREDANLFVRKRCYGINWSFNWGNPWTWVIVVAFVVAMVLIVILC